ncbi:hypothetical protein ACFYT4_35595 [Streptomyces sp. NPDC004609]|uniref:hypothetical protein n=1 Tax=Streptomyces sp. NPDC004609 TaxID=3364704 RepID=UPI0036C6BCB1
MGKKKPRLRRSFTPESKAEIVVELCRRGDRSVGQVARLSLGLSRGGWSDG